MLELEVLVVELGAIDGFSTCAIAGCEISTLDHELLDNTVEDRALIRQLLARFAFPFLARAEASKVLSGLWNDTIVELKSDSALCLLANGDIKEDAASLRTLVFCHLACFVDCSNFLESGVVIACTDLLLKSLEVSSGDTRTGTG